jgi:hypothetical protein
MIVNCTPSRVPRGRIEAPAEVAHRFGGGRVLQKIGNRLAKFVVAHGRGWRAQFADTEAAGNLVVVAVLVVGDQLANAGQQGRDRQRFLQGSCSRVPPRHP